MASQALVNKDPLSLSRSERELPESHSLRILDNDVQLVWKYWPAHCLYDEETGETNQGEFWTAGWKTTIKGNQYGDFVTVYNFPSTQTEAENVLLEQAELVIKKVLQIQ